MSEDNSIIPWHMSTVPPLELKSSTDPVKRAKQRDAAKGFVNPETCQRCGRYYRDENPTCPNAADHGDKAKRLNAYREGLRAWLNREKAVEPEEVLV